MNGYNEETNRRTEDGILADFERKFKDNPFPWDELKDLGIIPKNLVYSNELYNALLNCRYTPPVDLRVPGGFFQGDVPQVSIRAYPGKDGWKFNFQYVKPALTQDSTIVINKWTKLKPLDGEPVDEKQRKAEEVRRALISDGFYQGLVTVNKYNYKTKETESYKAGVCINPYTNQVLEMEPKFIRKFMFAKGNTYHGAELTEKQVEDICSFKEVLVEGMINGRGETYDRYVRFDIFNNTPRMSETPAMSQAQSQSHSQAQSLEERQEEVQEKKTTRAKGRGMH